MTDFYAYARENPFMTFVLAFVLAALVGNVLWALIVILPNRLLRHWNIRKHGYPPAHCDADGDFRPLDGDSQR